jgi:CBS domain-containing protein
MSKVNFKKSTVKNEIKTAQGPPTHEKKQNSIELVTFANAQTLEPESESEQALSAQAASAKAASAQAAPAQVAPVQAAPAQAAPPQAAPAQAAPAQAAPAQEAPAQEAPAQAAPPQTAPAQAAPAQAAPAQAAPAQTDPAQEAPVQESSVQGKMPVETPAPAQSKAAVQLAVSPSAQPEKVDSRQSDPYHAAQETERNFTDNDPYHAAQAPERKSNHAHAQAQTPAQDKTPDETVAKDEQTEKWEYTKEALQKHYAEQTKVAAPAEKQRQTPHEIVAAIMQRIQESRKGEDHQMVVEPNEDYPESQDGVLRLSDVMSKNVACVVDSTTVEQFAGLCHKRQITAVPIVDYQSMRYLGLISMSDIFSYTFSQKMLTSFDEGVMVQEDPMAVLDLPVRDFMDSQAMMEIAPDCTVQEACQRMIEHQLDHLVITHFHKVKGIFSAWDALSILASPN